MTHTTIILVRFAPSLLLLAPLAPSANVNIMIRVCKVPLSEMPLTREEWNDFFDRFYALDHSDCSNYTDCVFQLVLDFVED